MFNFHNKTAEKINVKNPFKNRHKNETVALNIQAKLSLASRTSCPIHNFNGMLFSSAKSYATSTIKVLSGSLSIKLQISSMNVHFYPSPRRVPRVLIVRTDTVSSSSSSSSLRYVEIHGLFIFSLM